MKSFSRMTAFLLALLIFVSSSHLTACASTETDSAQAEDAASLSTTAPASAEETKEAEATQPAATVPETEETTEETVAETLPEETKETAPPEEAEDADRENRKLPVYIQENYPETAFGSGTVADSGSSVTALAMVASFLTGYDYTPDALAGYFGKYADDDDALLEHAAKALGLPFRKAADFQDAYQSLERGCVAICKMSNQSVFTDDTHLIVLRGTTQDDKIYVSDPLGENQKKSMLRDGFAGGFPKGWISTGWEAGWIFDPGDVPADVEYYTGPKPLVREMPLYNQLDYKDVRYGAGTVANSGCGITALAMVATYMTGHTYTPDELADWFGGYNGNNIERLLNASDELKLPWQAAENWHVALKALGEGKIAILLMSGRSMFSDSQHFLVATGLTEDGKVKIHDPYGLNYDNPVLKDGFANGFTSSQIATGYSGSWIYDVDQMPEDPFIYEEEKTPYIEPRYGDLTLSDADMDLIARLVWVEAQGEPDDGQQAVAEVVLNRVYSDRFPNTVRGVIYAENQFRGTQYISTAKPTQTQYEAVERALYGPYILPMDVSHFATYPVNKDVWGTIGGHTFCYQWSPD